MPVLGCGGEEYVTKSRVLVGETKVNVCKLSEANWRSASDCVVQPGKACRTVNYIVNGKRSESGRYYLVDMIHAVTLTFLIAS